MQAVDERAEIGPLAHGVGERNRVAQHRPRARRFNFEVRVHDDGRQPGRHRKADHVGRIRHADQHETAAQRRHDVVGMHGPGGDALTLERAGDQRVDRRARVGERVDGNHRGRRARGAAAQAARQRQAFADGQDDVSTIAKALEKRLRRDAGGVARRLARQTPAEPFEKGPRGDARRIARRLERQTAAVARDLADRDAALTAGGERGRHFVARRLEREAEDVEAACDVRHRRRSEGSYWTHRDTEHSTKSSRRLCVSVADRSSPGPRGSVADSALG